MSSSWSTFEDLPFRFGPPGSQVSPESDRERIGTGWSSRTCSRLWWFLVSQTAACCGVGTEPARGEPLRRPPHFGDRRVLLALRSLTRCLAIWDRRCTWPRVATLGTGPDAHQTSWREALHFLGCFGATWADGFAAPVRFLVADVQIICELGRAISEASEWTTRGGQIGLQGCRPGVQGPGCTWYAGVPQPRVYLGSGYARDPGVPGPARPVYPQEAMK
jgi:hypothetical protein